MLSLARTNPTGRAHLTSKLLPPLHYHRPHPNPNQTRSVSTSPYGRTHIWKRRLPTLPNPIVPKFPQKVIRSDGSSFVQWSTSPRSLIRLTRDTTNNPVWNSANWISGAGGGLDEESGGVGRLGRFGRKFGAASSGVAPVAGSGVDAGEGPGSAGMAGALDDVSWFEQMADLTGAEEGKGRRTKKDRKDKK